MAQRTLDDVRTSTPRTVSVPGGQHVRVRGVHESWPSGGWRAVVRRAAWRLTALSLVAGVLLVVATAVVLRGGPDRGALVRDPLAVAQAGDAMPLYTGWLSHAGVLGWAAAATALALAAAVSLRRGTTRLAVHLGGAALLSALLCVDDLFMGHEWVIPELTGVGERGTYAALGVLGLVWAVATARELLSAPVFPVLVVSGAFLAASVLVEVGYLSALPEEGLKLAGVLCWVLWALGSAWAALVPADERGGRSARSALTTPA